MQVDRPGADYISFSLQKELGTSVYLFTAHNIIQSSFASFQAGGYNYNASSDETIASILAMSPLDITDGSEFTIAGVFNLAVCTPPGTLDDFFTDLAAPGDMGYPTR